MAKLKTLNDDMHVDAAQAGFGLDQLELMPSSVDQDHPAPVVARGTDLGMFEDPPHDMLGVVLDRSAQPLGLSDRSGPRDVVSRPAAGRGDHVMRAARGRLGARRQRPHREWPCVFGRFRRGGQAGAEGVLPLADGLPGASRNASGLITIPLPSMESTNTVVAVHGSMTRVS
ncbi:hypothetical protein [Streptomyces sp. NPDC054863]